MGIKKYNEEKKSFFEKTFKGHFAAFLVLSLSVITIINTSPSSYTFLISDRLAIFGPITFLLIGLIMLAANIRFNYKLIKNLIKL